MNYPDCILNVTNYPTPEKKQEPFFKKSTKKAETISVHKNSKKISFFETIKQKTNS